LTTCMWILVEDPGMSILYIYILSDIILYILCYYYYYYHYYYSYVIIYHYIIIYYIIVLLYYYIVIYYIIALLYYYIIIYYHIITHRLRGFPKPRIAQIPGNSVRRQTTGRIFMFIYFAWVLT
jgi:predicted membrane protein